MPLFFLRIIVARRTLILFRVLGVACLLAALFLPVCRDLRGQLFTGQECLRLSFATLTDPQSFQPWQGMMACYMLLTLLVAVSFLLGLSERYVGVKMVLAHLAPLFLVLLSVFLFAAQAHLLPGFFFWLAAMLLIVFPAAFTVPALEVN